MPSQLEAIFTVGHVAIISFCLSAPTLFVCLNAVYNAASIVCEGVAAADPTGIATNLCLAGEKASQ